VAPWPPRPFGTSPLSLPCGGCQCAFPWLRVAQSLFFLTRFHLPTRNGPFSRAPPPPLDFFPSGFGLVQILRINAPQWPTRPCFFLSDRVPFYSQGVWSFLFPSIIILSLWMFKQLLAVRFRPFPSSLFFFFFFLFRRNAVGQ